MPSKSKKLISHVWPYTYNKEIVWPCPFSKMLMVGCFPARLIFMTDVCNMLMKMRWMNHNYTTIGNRAFDVQNSIIHMAVLPLFLFCFLWYLFSFLFVPLEFYDLWLCLFFWISFSICSCLFQSCLALWSPCLGKDSWSISFYALLSVFFVFLLVLPAGCGFWLSHSMEFSSNVSI